MASRRLSDLSGAVERQARALVIAAESAGLDLLIYCTLRELDEQARLYRRGRTLAAINRKINKLTTEGRPDLATILADVGPQSGRKIVTWAAPGESLHNYGLAFDTVPQREGRLVWTTRDKKDRVLWHLYGQLVEDQGLEWAGRWSPRKREYPHAQAAGYNRAKLLEFGT